jgi:hypothetical protein
VRTREEARAHFTALTARVRELNFAEAGPPANAQALEALRHSRCGRRRRRLRPKTEPPRSNAEAAAQSLSFDLQLLWAWPRRLDRTCLAPAPPHPRMPRHHLSV